MASYVVVRHADVVHGDREVLAVVVDDGHRIEVLGSSDLADDILRRSGDVQGDGPDQRIASVLTGFSHYHLDGPIPVDGSTRSVLDVLASLYGL